MVFLLQFISGLLLSCYFSAFSSMAFDSVYYLMISYDSYWIIVKVLLRFGRSVYFIINGVNVGYCSVSIEVFIRFSLVLAISAKDIIIVVINFIRSSLLVPSLLLIFTDQTTYSFWISILSHILSTSFSFFLHYVISFLLSWCLSFIDSINSIVRFIYSLYYILCFFWS